LLPSNHEASAERLEREEKKRGLESLFQILSLSRRASALRLVIRP